MDEKAQTATKANRESAKSQTIMQKIMPIMSLVIVFVVSYLHRSRPTRKHSDAVEVVHAVIVQ